MLTPCTSWRRLQWSISPPATLPAGWHGEGRASSYEARFADTPPKRRRRSHQIPRYHVYHGAAGRLRPWTTRGDVQDADEATGHRHGRCRRDTGWGPGGHGRPSAGADPKLGGHGGLWRLPGDGQLPH